jgi:hypothetical protein
VKGTIVLCIGGAAFAGAVIAGGGCIPDLPPADQPPDAAAELTACGNGVTEFGLHEQCDPGRIAQDASFQGCRSDCTIDCPNPGFVWSKNNHCYTLNQKATSLAAAKKECSGPGMHVVTFASDEELKAVVSHFAAESVRGPFWVGLSSNASSGDNQYSALTAYEPGWSPTCAGCFARTEVSDAALPAAPDSGPTNNCVEGFFSVDASWQQYPCNNGGRLWVICEREPVGTTAHACDGGLCVDIPFTYPEKHYLYVPLELGADAASQYCAARGGTLVVLQSRDEREQLWYELFRDGILPQPNNSLPIWIGLSFVDGGWVWDDEGGAGDYPPPWADTYPSLDGTTRAALVLFTGSPPPFDWTLAQNGATADDGSPFLCQLLPQVDAGDAGGDAAPSPEGGDAGDGAVPGDDGGAE